MIGDPPSNRTPSPSFEVRRLHAEKQCVHLFVVNKGTGERRLRPKNKDISLKKLIFKIYWGTVSWGGSSKLADLVLLNRLFK